jgi:hypothetical protein
MLGNYTTYLGNVQNNTMILNTQPNLFVHANIDYCMYTKDDNTGFEGFYDVFNKLDSHVESYISIRTDNISILEVILSSYLNEFYNNNTNTKVFSSSIKDHEITRFKVGNNYIYEGIVSKFLTFLLPPENATYFVNIDTYAYTNDAYVFNYGNTHLSDEVLLSTISFKIVVYVV